MNLLLNASIVWTACMLGATAVYLSLYSRKSRVPPRISGHPGFRKSNVRNSNLTFTIALKFGENEEK